MIGADDIPFAGDFDGDGRADPAVVIPADAALYIWKSSSDYAQTSSYPLP